MLIPAGIAVIGLAAIFWTFQLVTAENREVVTQATPDFGIATAEVQLATVEALIATAKAPPPVVVVLATPVPTALPTSTPAPTLEPTPEWRGDAYWGPALSWTFGLELYNDAFIAHDYYTRLSFDQCAGLPNEVECWNDLYYGLMEEWSRIYWMDREDSLRELGVWPTDGWPNLIEGWACAEALTAGVKTYAEGPVGYFRDPFWQTRAGHDTSGWVIDNDGGCLIYDRLGFPFRWWTIVINKGAEWGWPSPVGPLFEVEGS